MESKNPATIEEYILSSNKDVQVKLNEMYQIIKKIAPEASEKISYGMPTFYLNGNLVHFAAHKNHIGFYPAPSAIENFEEKISEFKKSKGAIQFPLDKELPTDLIKEIVKFRVKENTQNKGTL